MRGRLAWERQLAPPTLWWRGKREKGAMRATCLHLSVLLIAPLLISCAGTVDPAIYGAWEGHAWFLDVALKEYGAFQVKVEVNEDDRVTGTVGAASIEDGKIRKWRFPPESGMEVTGRLSGPVFEGGPLPDQKKDCVIMMIELEDGAYKDANLHLKTNYYWDFTMRVCGLKLAPVPPQEEGE